MVGAAFDHKSRPLFMFLLSCHDKITANIWPLRRSCGLRQLLPSSYRQRRCDVTAVMSLLCNIIVTVLSYRFGTFGKSVLPARFRLLEGLLLSFTPPLFLLPKPPQPVSLFFRIHHSPPYAHDKVVMFVCMCLFVYLFTGQEPLLQRSWRRRAGPQVLCAQTARALQWPDDPPWQTHRLGRTLPAGKLLTLTSHLYTQIHRHTRALLYRITPRLRLRPLCMSPCFITVASFINRIVASRSYPHRLTSQISWHCF